MKAIGDSGYNGFPSKVTTSHGSHSKEFCQFIARAKDRQESFNSRLKAFNVLSARFRHGSSTKDKMDRHKACVEAICVLVQYDMDNGYPLFQV
jgi:hypothetical protein